MYDVIIVGGGASGLACALTLASSRSRGWNWAEGRTYLVFDTGESDLHKAYLKNVPGVQPMTGTQLLEVIREQIKDWGGVEFSNEKVVEIKKDGEVYKVYTETGKEYSAKYVVLAGGFKEFSIKGLELKVVGNPKSPKPGRVMIKHKDFEAMPNLFVVGTLAGLSSHFTSCAGSGVEVAIEILSRMAGKRIVIHDVPQD
ncbi:MAG: FAD-dependent oxidoreductase [Thermocrinis sp.]|jgi:thioredoxin reductase|uniref:FAD-dependent oxidoreductase n=1 Tax=Thermocrinis sp. TaxID=2024383 RepID=UPI003C02619C